MILLTKKISILTKSKKVYFGLSTFIFLLFSITAWTQDLKYLSYDKDLVSPKVFKCRRDSLMKLMGKESMAIFYSGPERQRNGDVNFLFHQDENFYYLTGFNEPNSILLLIPAGLYLPSISDSTKKIKTQEILLVQKRVKSKEQWTGRTFGVGGALNILGMDYSMTTDQFPSIFLRALESEGLKILFYKALADDANASMKNLLSPVSSYLAEIDSRHVRKTIIDPRPLLFQLRSIKSEEEISLIRKASEISAFAHRQSMKSVEPGMYEYQLQGIYEYIYHIKGAEYTGYPCIIGSGENSVILHYESNRKQIQNGELVLADCAAEYHNYSSDVTRTYPANGHFSPEQRAIYEIVLKAQKACIEMVKKGTQWKEVQLKSEEIITDGLFRLGIIKEKSYTQMRRFYMHGVGHPVGLNVHDVGINNFEESGQRVLKPGMLYTVEPGIYISEGSEGVDPKYFNVGVRIEDVILVTVNGNENLSAGAPREIKDIESLMREKGIGNIKLN